MRDPYEVLGVGRNATQEEITVAYRRLAKQYHPDLHPGDSSAQKKMSEINVAYEEIKSGRARYQDYSQPQQRQQPWGRPYAQRQSNPYGGFDPFGPFGPFGSAQFERRQAQEMGDQLDPARRYINAMRYQEALFALSQARERSAEWYYLSAIANFGVGNTASAIEHIDQAVSMAPDNFEYQNVRRQIYGAANPYATRRQTFGMPAFGMNGLCLGLCAARLLCMFCRPY